MSQNNNLEFFKKLAKKKWYTQAGSGVSIYICACASSGFRIKEKLGFSYNEFTFITDKGYVQMNYLADDVVRLWGIIREKIRINIGG
ncbi:MAG: hypothetical protein Q7S37_00690 [bacterium]|nr:hypothetical protein [bacterium]